MYLYDFIDQEHYTGLEAMLIRHAPEHVYMSDVSAAENKKLQQLVEGAADMGQEFVAKGKFFADGEVVSALEKLGGAGTIIDGDEVRGERPRRRCYVVGSISLCALCAWSGVANLRGGRNSVPLFSGGEVSTSFLVHLDVALRFEGDRIPPSPGTTLCYSPIRAPHPPCSRRRAVQVCA